MFLRFGRQRSNAPLRGKTVRRAGAKATPRCSGFVLGGITMGFGLVRAFADETKPAVPEYRHFPAPPQSPQGDAK